MLSARLCQNGEMEIPRPSSSTVRPATVARMRQLLEAHLGAPVPWSDAEIAEMLTELMQLVMLIRQQPNDH